MDTHTGSQIHLPLHARCTMTLQSCFSSLGQQVIRRWGDAAAGGCRLSRAQLSSDALSVKLQPFKAIFLAGLVTQQQGGATINSLSCCLCFFHFIQKSTKFWGFAAHTVLTFLLGTYTQNNVMQLHSKWADGFEREKQLERRGEERRGRHSVSLTGGLLSEPPLTGSE